MNLFHGHAAAESQESPSLWKPRFIITISYVIGALRGSSFTRNILHHLGCNQNSHIPGVTKYLIADLTAD